MAVDKSIEINRIKEVINSNNVSAIQELINPLGPDKESAEGYIAQAFEELKVKNAIKEYAQFEIIKYLVKKRFESKMEVQITDEELKERLKFTGECIEDIIKEHSRLKDDCDDDDAFILISKFIAKNLHLLRKENKVAPTFTRLPWEEMEFCLSIFIHSSLQKSKSIYSVIIDKNKILNFLKAFLAEYKVISDDIFQNRENIRNLKRHEIRNAVMENNINFSELYDSYDLMKNVYSLSHILSYLEVATSVDLKNDGLMGKLVLERALQVTGEYLKDTKESPNISDKVSRLLHQTGPEQLRNVAAKLRNSLSHIPSLTKRMELEDDEDQTFFSCIFNDLKKIQTDIRCILYSQKFNILLEYRDKNIESIGEEFRQENDKLEEIFSEEFLKIINVLEEIKQKYCTEDSEDVDNIKNVIETHETALLEMKQSYLRIIKELYECEYNPSLSYDILRINLSHNNSEITLRQKQFANDFTLFKIEKLYKKILSKYPNNIRDVNNLFNQLLTLVYNQKQINGVNQMNKVVKENLYSEKRKRVCDVLFQLEDSLNDENTQLLRKRVKARMDLEKISYLVKVKKALLTEEEKNIKDIMIQCGIHESSLSESTNITALKDKIDTNNYFGTLLKKVEGFYVFSYKKDIEFLEKFLNKLELKTIVGKGIENLIRKNKSNVVEYLSKRLNQLNNINISDPKGVLAIEMLILDLLEILNYTESLASSRYILETVPPLLIGRALRNYLAHGDALVDVLMDKRTISDILRANALELINRGKDLLDQKNTLVGQNTLPDTKHAKDLYNEQLRILKIQRNLFSATKEGDSEKFKLYRSQGGDISAVNTSGWSCVHFAAKGNKLNLLRILHNEGCDIKMKDKRGYTALLVAAEYGSLDVLQYLIVFEKSLLPAKLSKLLNLAVKHGHANVVQILIEKIKNYCIAFDTILDPYFNALHTAVQANQLEMVAELIRVGYRTNTMSNNNYTALHFAAKNGHVEISKLLIQNKADVNRVNCFGFAPLHFAASGGHIDVVQVLLDARAEVNLKSVEHYEYTPLHVAAIHGRAEIATVLINRGADVKASNINGYQAIHLAARAGIELLVELLIKNGINVDEATSDGLTCLHLAASSGATCMVRYLLSKGANVNAEDHHKATPLHVAACYGHVYVIRSMAIVDIMDVQAINENGSTPLHSACYFGHVEAVRALLDRGANPSIKGSDRKTPLQMAALLGWEKIVKLLIGKSAVEDINVSFMGSTFSKSANTVREFLEIIDDNKLILEALSRAGVSGDAEIFKMIIAQVYNFSDLSTFYKIVESSIEIGHANIVKILLQKLPKIIEFDTDHILLKSAILGGHEVIVEELVIHGANINYLFEDGCSPLMIASEKGSVYIVDVLLKYGADACQVTKERSVLHCATISDHKQTIELIITAIELNVEGGLKQYKVKDECGDTPLMWAAENGANDAIRLLLKHGVDVSEKNHKGQTALMWAQQAGHREAVEILINHEENLL